MTTSPTHPTWTGDVPFRTIFEQSPVSTQVFSPDGQTIAVNRAWERLWSASWADVREYNILQDEQLEQWGVLPLIRRAFAGEAVSVPAIRYEPPPTIPGVVPYRWVRSWLYPLTDDAGTVREVVLMHEDLTEQRRAEESRAETEAQFRAIFYHAPVGISLVDAEGRYLAVNPARQRMLGYTEAEMIGRHFLEFTFPDDVGYDQAVNAEARQQARDSFQLEKRFVRQDGSIEWTRITAATIRNPAGEVLYSISIAEDITALKETEEERQRWERQKDEFLSAVAHDLRTPLTTIKGGVQMLQLRSRRGQITPENLQESLARIDASTGRMVALINELLEVANIQLGRPLELARETVDLVALVRMTAREYADVSSRHRVIVDAAVPALMGEFDPARIDRVLSNLLSNAIKYSPDGCEIRVTVATEEADGREWAVVSVQDQGIGIPSADLPAIFDRFHRGGNTRASIPGTGIGLAAVHEIVTRHGGTITVESNEGEGACFTVRLPLHPVPGGAIAPSGTED